MKTKFTYRQFKNRYVKNPIRYYCAKNTKKAPLRLTNVLDNDTGDVVIYNIPLQNAIYLKDYYNQEDEHYLKQIYHYWCDHPF